MEIMPLPSCILLELVTQAIVSSSVYCLMFTANMHTTATWYCKIF